MIIVSAVTGEVRAQSAPESAITYRAPRGCPDGEWLRAQITRYLGRAPDGVTATVTLRNRGTGWTVTVRTRTAAGKGEVTHRGTQCSILADAAALIIAMAIDPAAGATKPPTPPKVSEKPSPSWVAVDDEIPPLIQRDRTPRDVGAARASDSWFFDIPKAYASVRVMFGSDAGSLPSAEPGLGAAITGHLGRVWIDWSVLAFGESRAELDAMDSKGSEFRLLSSTLRGCVVLVRGFGSWSGCGTVEAGQLSARPYGVEVVNDEDRVWWSLGGGLSASWSISKTLGIRVDAEAARNARRYRFQLENMGLFQPALVHWRGFVGFERRFE